MRGLHILATLHSQIWAMEPNHLSGMAAVLRRWSSGAQASPDVMAGIAEAQDARAARSKASSTVSSGIAVIPLCGIISPKASMVDDVSGGGTASLQSFSQALDAAIADSSVGAVIIDFDTPGGNVVMTPETASKVLAARAVKPVFGYVSGMCASAGYWIASACTELYSTPSASIGSIGVYTTHVDESAAMEMAGYAQEFISAGTYKVEGNSLAPLDDDARAFTQSQIDAFYSMFTNAVAKGRGAPIASVRDGFGQGRCLLADSALAEGMIDGVCSFQEIINKARKAIRTTGASALVGGTEISAEIPSKNIKYFAANALKRSLEIA